jgi:hypothetical protein
MEKLEVKLFIIHFFLNIIVEKNGLVIDFALPGTGVKIDTWKVKRNTR